MLYFPREENRKRRNGLTTKFKPEDWKLKDLKAVDKSMQEIQRLSRDPKALQKRRDELGLVRDPITGLWEKRP